MTEQPFATTKQQHPLQAPLYMLYSDNSITAQAQEDAQHHWHISMELGGVAHSEDGVITRWYLHDYKGDVLNTFNTQGTLLSDNVYSPYGMQYNRLSTAIQSLPAMLQLKNKPPWWQSHLPGFDDQMQDPATGYQFLGGGYRAYNPVYRHFMSKDSFSPFKKIDGYGFGANNPVMNVDPSGHFPQAASIALGAFGIFVSLILGVLLPVAGAAMTAAGVVATSVGTGTGTAISLGVVNGILSTTGVTSGSLQIAGAIHPRDKALATCNTWFGVAGGIATISMGEFAGIVGIANAITAVATNTAININRIINTAVAVSGFSGAVSGLTGEASTTLGIAIEQDTNLAKSNGIQQALEVLGGISMALMGLSTATGIGLITGGTVMGAASAIMKTQMQTTGNNEGIEMALLTENWKEPASLSYEHETSASETDTNDIKHSVAVENDPESLNSSPQDPLDGNLIDANTDNDSSKTSASLQVIKPAADKASKWGYAAFGYGNGVSMVTYGIPTDTLYIMSYEKDYADTLFSRALDETLLRHFGFNEKSKMEIIPPFSIIPFDHWSGFVRSPKLYPDPM